jgi:hypothetical protein
MKETAGYGGARDYVRSNTSIISWSSTLAGRDVMAMMRKGQVRKIGGCDMRAWTIFIAGLFQIAA